MHTIKIKNCRLVQLAMFRSSALAVEVTAEKSLPITSITSNFWCSANVIHQSQFLLRLFVHRNTKIPLIPNPS
jgi:hypothetical protein